jgi:hypothetical protein
MGCNFLLVIFVNFEKEGSALFFLTGGSLCKKVRGFFNEVILCTPLIKIRTYARSKK